MLLIIDRDGTLLASDDFPGKEHDWKGTIKINKPVAQFVSHLKNVFNVTSIVVSNQAGVARGYFDLDRVKAINSKLNQELMKSGIKIDSWQFCPDVDGAYLKKNPEVKILENYIKEKTKRKPSPKMVFDGLLELKKNIKDFDTILVLGNQKDDADLAKNLNARFINVVGKTLKELIDILAVI